MNQSGLYRGEDGTLSQPGGPNLSEKWVAMGSDGKQELGGASSWDQQIISSYNYSIEDTQLQLLQPQDT